MSSLLLLVSLLGLLPVHPKAEAQQPPPLECRDPKGRVTVPAATIRQVGHGVSQPEAIRRVRPAWPKSARPSGPTILEAVIDASGGICAVRVLKASSSDVGEAAVAALREFKYKPARFKGKAVPVRLTVVVFQDS